MALLANPIVILGLLLVLSSGANWGLYKLWQGRVEENGALVSQRDQAIQAGQECSRNTARLARAAADREKKLQAAVVAAAKAAKLSAAKSDATLAAMPKFPDDACRSSLDLSKKKLDERSKGVRP